MARTPALDQKEFYQQNRKNLEVSIYVVDKINFVNFTYQSKSAFLT